MEAENIMELREGTENHDVPKESKKIHPSRTDDDGAEVKEKVKSGQNEGEDEDESENSDGEFGHIMFYKNMSYDDVPEKPKKIVDKDDKARKDNIKIEEELGRISKSERTPAASNVIGFSPRQRGVFMEIEALLEERPILTTAFLKDKLQHLSNEQIRSVIFFCGYRFKTGPWQRAIIRDGYDPRTDRESRFYQTVVLERQPFRIFDVGNKAFLEEAIDKFQKDGDLYRCFPHTRPDPDNVPYMFNGRKVRMENDVWQICDLTDPALSAIAATTELNDTYTWESGWFLNGTWAKLHVIAKDKLLRLQNNQPPLDYKCLLSIPDKYLGSEDDDEGYGLQPGESYTWEQSYLRSRILKLARDSLPKDKPKKTRSTKKQRAT
jgi:RNA polymerase III transcription factor (TF)IIIC subunit HTH domain